MADTVVSILYSVLLALYQHFGAALVLSICAAFMFLYIEEHGCKEAMRKLLSSRL